MPSLADYHLVGALGPANLVVPVDYRRSPEWRRQWSSDDWQEASSHDLMQMSNLWNIFMIAPHPDFLSKLPTTHPAVDLVIEIHPDHSCRCSLSTGRRC